jgi:multiple sugar transport system ATP-binding protein
MADVVFDRVSRIYPGALRPAVNRLSLEIADGEFLCLVGPSGCGKSTCLRMLAGLDEVNLGKIRIGNRDVTDVPAKDRDIAMVFQSYALYSHMTVFDNIAFSLKMAKVPKEEIRQRVANAAKILDLERFLERRPAALSGGQRQRVAMGRAIVRQPQVFCMDEPLSNLDAKLRVSTRAQIAALQRRLGVTTVYVTHDQIEAMTMGDRVAVLKDGVLMQCDTPLVLYDRPENVFVAGFIGSPAMNVHTFPVIAEHARIGPIDVPLTRATLSALAAEGSNEIVIGFRPESLEVVGEDRGFPVRVDVVEELGMDAFAYGNIEDANMPAEEREIIVRVDAAQPPAKGERIFLHVHPEEQHAFSTKTGERLPV